MISLTLSEGKPEPLDISSIEGSLPSCWRSLLCTLIILFMFSGFFYGILYGAASKLFITLNVLKKTSKYSGILESSTGLSYFASQIFLGIIADIHILLGYLSLSLSLIFLSFINFVLIRKFKEFNEIT